MQNLQDYAGIAVSYAVPLVVCCLIGSVFSLIDFDRYIKKSGTAPMSYLASPVAVFFFVCSGMAAPVVLICWNRTSTRPIGAADFYFRAAVVGVSLPAIIKSKFFSYQDYKFGLEQFYDAFLNWAAAKYKRVASSRRLKLASDLSQRYHDSTHCAEDLVRFVQNAIDHQDQASRDKFDTEVARLRGLRDANALSTLRHLEFLIALCIDHTSISAITQCSVFQRPP